MAKNPHAVALGRTGGRVTSDAKAQAARRNGKKGGRRRLRCKQCHRREEPTASGNRPVQLSASGLCRACVCHNEEAK